MPLARGAVALLFLFSGCSAVDVDPSGAPVAAVNIIIGIAGRYADERGRLLRKHTPFLRIWSFRISSGGRVTWDRPASTGEDRAEPSHFAAPRLRLRAGKDVVYFQLIFRF